jgi:hypothetical protein
MSEIKDELDSDDAACLLPQVDIIDIKQEHCPAEPFIKTEDQVRMV